MHKNILWLNIWIWVIHKKEKIYFWRLLGEFLALKNRDLGHPTKDVLFSILRKVLEQEENRDIRTFYRGEIISKMNDHVINDWSDGKRCIGLSNETMMKRYSSILKRKYRTDSRFEFLRPTFFWLNLRKIEKSEIFTNKIV